ncbi:MAG: hypothetical protein ACLUDQ_05690 [Bilophila wadsworthia]
MGGLNQKLANEGFVSRAPAEIVERARPRRRTHRRPREAHRPPAASAMSA